MPKSNNERLEALRKRRLAEGLKRREFYLTDAEKVKVSEFIKQMRAK